MATLLQALGARVLALAGLARQSDGTRWLWPPGPPGGGWGMGGDRGPPGAWQMGRNSPRANLELLAFSAVYACINLIASDISKLPLQIFAVNLSDGTRRLLRTDYYAQLFKVPNEYQTCSDFLLGFVQSYLSQGNTYCYIGDRNGRGEVQSMHVLNPYRVVPLIDETGAIYYRVYEDYLSGLVNGQVVPERDMIHHRLQLLPGYPLVGVTPIFAAAASSALGLKILQDSQQFFANSSRPSGVLSSETFISEENKTRYKTDWELAYSGGQMGKTAVLGGGMKWQPLTITAQDAQLIEQLRYSVEDVARVFRVPTFMLGDMSKVSYRNVETLGRVFITECLGFHIEALQQRFARAFDFPLSYEIRFDLAAFLRTEVDVRYAAYQTALNAGWQSINEVRAQEGLEPVDGGAEPRVQMQYVPLSQATGPPPATPAVLPPVDSTVQPDEPQPAAAGNAGAADSAPFDPARVRALLRERLERRPT